MRRLLKWFAIILLTLVLLILCAILLSYLLLGTERGFRLTLGQLEERVEGLELGEIEGSLKNGVQTDQINFKNEQILLNAKGVDTRWRSGCLVDKALCIDKVIIDELNIETFASGETKPASTDDITLPEVILPVSFDAKEILIKKLNFQAPGDAPLQELTNIKLSAYSDKNTLHIDELSTQYKNISLQSSGSITPTGAYPLDLNLQVGVDDFLEEYDATTNIKLSNTLEALDIDVVIGGAVDAHVTGTVQPLLKKLPANLKIRTQQVGWPLDTNEQVQVSNLSLLIDGDIDDYHVDLKTSVIGEQIPQTNVDVKAQANLDRALVTDFTVLTLDGLATGKAAVSWKNGVVWVTDMIAKDINPGVKFDGADGKLNALIVANGDLVDGKWTLDLNKAQIDGELRDLPFKLDTKLIKNADETWQLDSLVLDNGRNQVNAKGTLTEQWDVNAKINLPELQNLLPGLTGGFNANIDVKGDLKNPDAKIKARSDAIKYKEFALAGFALDADIKNGVLKDSELDLTVAKIQAGVQTVSNAKLDFDGSRKSHTLSFFADGPQKTSVDLTAIGGFNKNYDWKGSLNKVKLEVPAHVITLRDPTDLAWNNTSKKFSVEPHCWAIQESNLCLKNQVLAQESGQALIGLDAYRLEQLDPFLPAESTLKGKLSADITFDWGSDFAGGYAAKLDAGITGGAIKVRDTSGQPLSFMYDKLTLNTTADAQAVASELTIDSDSMGQAQIDLSLDPASEKKNITGNVNLSGFKIGFLKAFLPNYETISGSVSAKGTLSGELLDPLYNGDVVLSSLIVKAEDLPLAIDDGKITTTVNGKRAKINGKVKSGDGSVDVEGTANWLNNSYRADITVKANQLNIVQDPLTSSTVNTRLKISANPARIRVRGSVDIPAAEINIKELPRGAANLSEDVIVIEDVYAQTQKKQKKQQEAAKIDLKVSVNLGDNVNLSGYGLKANLTGGMSVSQNSPNPVQLGGEVTIVSGIFKQYGQDLKITDGQVLFVGPVDQTTLNIDAVREIKSSETDRIAGLHITGALEDPDIALFTEPADKTQESILSFIVLGRDVTEASKNEQNLLASAALALAIKGGRTQTKDLAEKLGIQEISLDARSRDDTTELVVSGRVNDRLLIRYGQSIFDDTFTLYLRYDLTKQLYLEAAQGTARAVDIFYSFAF